MRVMARLCLSSLKFLRTYSAHERIAELMYKSLPYLAKDTVTTHIPTSLNRVRSRGYDQPRLLAKGPAYQRGLSHATMLTRLTNTRQVGASRLERRKQLNNAYHVNSYRDITKKSPILLVDDIYTTGGTLSVVVFARLCRGRDDIVTTTLVLEVNSSTLACVTEHLVTILLEQNTLGFEAPPTR